MTQEGPRRYDAIAPVAPDGLLVLDGLIPGDGPFEIDVGFGRGMSLFTRAEAAPEVRLLGIEIKHKWAYLTAERAKRMGLHRVRVLSGDAREILARLGPDGGVARVFVHFPDPWWKKRHTKRRVLSDAFLDTLARLVMSGGDLYVQTDVEDRAELYAASIEAHPAFELVSADLTENPFGSISNRERRAAEDGLPVHRMLARRR